MRRLFPVLRTARLELRACASADVDGLLRVVSEPGVRRFLLDGARIDRGWIEEEVASTRASWRTNGWGQFAIRLARRGPIVGVCGLRPLHDAGEPELLYALCAEHRGRGLAREAVAAVVRFAFDELRFDLVRATTDLDDVASHRLLRRLGLELVTGGDVVRGSLGRGSWSAPGDPWGLAWDASG